MKNNEKKMNIKKFLIEPAKMIWANDYTKITWLTD